MIGDIQPSPEGAVQSLEAVRVEHVDRRVSPKQAEHERAQANQRLTFHKGVAWVFIAFTFGLSVAAFVLLWQAATSSQPEIQKLAYGVIGGALGALWSHVGKLVERITSS